VRFERIFILGVYRYRLRSRLEGFRTPFKLALEQVGFGGSILAIADIYCALIESRPYRESLTAQVAIAIM